MEKGCDGGEGGCPSTAENASDGGNGCNEHGCITVNVTEKTCGLPCAGAPELSVALILTCAVYVPGVRPATFTLTWILADSPLALIDLEEGVSASQAGRGEG